MGAREVLYNTALEGKMELPLETSASLYQPNKCKHEGRGWGVKANWITFIREEKIIQNKSKPAPDKYALTQVILDQKYPKEK